MDMLTKMETTKCGFALNDYIMIVTLIWKFAKNILLWLGLLKPTFMLPTPDYVIASLVWENWPLVDARLLLKRSHVMMTCVLLEYCKSWIYNVGLAPT